QAIEDRLNLWLIICCGVRCRSVFGCFDNAILLTCDSSSFARFLAFGRVIPLAFQPPHFLLSLLESLHGDFLFASQTLNARRSWMEGRCFESLFPSAARAAGDRNRRRFRDRRHPGPWDELH